MVPVACVHIRGVSAIQGAGLEGLHCKTSHQYLIVCKVLESFNVHSISWPRKAHEAVAMR